MYVNHVLAQLRMAVADGYTIQRELGGGGMSRVFLATETALGRDVVVKVISPEVMGDASADRFARDAALVTDFGIAKAIALSKTEAPGAPFVMQCLEKQPSAAYTLLNRAPATAALQQATQLTRWAFIVTSDGGDQPVQVSRGVGPDERNPIWSSDGSRIAWQMLDASRPSAIAVDVATRGPSGWGAVARLDYGASLAILRLIMASLRRFLHAPAASFFLLGPRGTGKTTWLRTTLPDALVVNLLRPDVHREMQARPERLRELVLGAAPGTPVVLDEVQRVPELLTVVHDLIESGRPHRFALTGSSARKLRRGGTDLLAGRAVMRTMHPFMAAELPSFDLSTALLQGLVPLVTMADDPADTLAAYAGLYLDQEVKAEGLTRKVGNFARFLEVVAFSHGAILNVSNVARESQVSRKTVEGYLEILDDLLLACQLPVFTRRAQRATVSHAKFYLFDAGVFRSLRPRGPLDRPEEIDGAALEGLVAQHLRAWAAYSRESFELAYWRTRSGVEVDFVVYGSAGFWAMEVKNSMTVRRDDVRALKTFVADYPECEPLLLYRGEESLVVNGVRCMPVHDFLVGLRPDDGLTDTRGT